MDGGARSIAEFADPVARLRRLGGAMLLVLLTACTGCRTSFCQWWNNGAKVGPNYRRPGAPVAAEWIDESDVRIHAGSPADCGWWMTFNDPILNGLIAAAYRQNLDLRTAATRILEARAQRGIAVGNLFPQSQTATSAYVHAQISRNLNLPFPSPISVWADGFNASWELDFWGRYRRSIESADAGLAATVEDYGNSLVMMLSEVANNYVQLRTFQQRLAFAQHNVDIQKGSLRLARDRFQNGVASELDVRQAGSNLAQTESLIPPLAIGVRQANNRLCVLLGMPVSDLASKLPGTVIPRPPLDVAVGIPAQLLRRRPDVRRAERQAAAESAQIGVAEADLYPRLSINGFLGYAASDLDHLVTPRSFLGVIFPTLQWNVLNYGRVVNNIKTEDAQFARAVYQYQQTVLVAGREVEDALVGFLQSQLQANFLERSVREAQRSVELVTEQFEAGATDFNRVYNTQSLLVNQQDQLAVTQGNIALNLIAVYRALGGGWQCFCRGQGMPDSSAFVRKSTSQPAQAQVESVPVPPESAPAGKIAEPELPLR